MASNCEYCQHNMEEGKSHTLFMGMDKVFCSSGCREDYLNIHFEEPRSSFLNSALYISSYDSCLQLYKNVVVPELFSDSIFTTCSWNNLIPQTMFQSYNYVKDTIRKFNLA